MQRIKELWKRLSLKPASELKRWLSQLSAFQNLSSIPSTHILKAGLVACVLVIPALRRQRQNPSCSLAIQLSLIGKLQVLGKVPVLQN